MTMTILYLAASLMAFWLAFRLSSEIRTKRNWPTTPGRIIERGVGKLIDHNSYLAHVRYTYRVGGKEHTNDQVYLIRQTGEPPKNVQRLVDGLPDPVPVRYDAGNPADSYLIVNSMAVFWILLGLGILALLVGAMQLVASTSNA